MRTMKIGLIGLGTVGSGVLHILRTHGEDLRRRTGIDFQVVRYSSRSPGKWVGMGLDPKAGTTNPMEVAQDPDVELLVELMGGVELPRRIVLSALGSGKHVVTANKALLSEHGDEIFAAAAKTGRLLGFEASVCGGVPIILLLKTGFAAERIMRLVGIVNGTCNYILTGMTRGLGSLEEVLARAQELGYAEADPSLDISGEDSAHKLALLAQLAWGVRLSSRDIPVTGITKIDPLDIRFAEELGMVIKLLAGASRVDGDRLTLSVRPTLVPSSSVMGQVAGPVNAVLVDGEHVGPFVVTGAGAGGMPTAGAVVADLVELAGRIREGVCVVPSPPTGFPEESRPQARLVPPEDHRGACYLRISAIDKPGVLASVATRLAEGDIGIARVIQHGRDLGETVPVVILTHEARAGDLEEAVRAIDDLPAITRETVVMNLIEDLP